MKTYFLSFIFFFTALGVVQSQDCDNDMDAPTAICLEGLVIGFSTNTSVTLWAQDIDAGSSDACSEVALSFSEDGSTPSMEFTASMNYPVIAVLWVTDASGNQNSCWTNINANFSNCENDAIPPVAICEDTIVVNLNSEVPPALFAYELDEGSYDNCSQSLQFSFSEEIGNDMIELTLVESFPFDTTMWVTDENGNQSACFSTIVLSDCSDDVTPPTPYCVNGIAIDFLPGNEPFSIFAIDFDAGSFDDCSSVLQFSFSEDVNDNEIIINDDSPPIIQLAIWVTDENGNQDFCSTFVKLSTNPDGELVTGHIRTPQGEGVANVIVKAVADGSTLTQSITDSNGYYTLAGISEGSSFTVIPEKDDDYMNGVTIWDLLIMHAYILAIEEINPYSYIAGDINRSNTITAFDLVALRKLILGFDIKFENNTSWRFIDADYVFPNPSNPFAEAFPELWNVESFETTVTKDFVAVKIGDLNGTANTQD